METPGETASVSSMVAQAGVRSPPKPARGSLVRLSPAPACRGAFLLTTVDVQGCPLGPGTHRRTVSPEHWRTVQSVQGLEAPVGGRGGRHGAQAKRRGACETVCPPGRSPACAGGVPSSPRSELRSVPVTTLCPSRGACDFPLVPGPGTSGPRMSFVATFSGAGLAFLNLGIYQPSPHSPPGFPSWKPLFQVETFNLNYSHTTGNTQNRTDREILSA